MNTMYGTPAGASGTDPVGTPHPYRRSRKSRMLRWGVGVTLAGFLAGGGIAWAVSSGSPAASTSAATGSSVSAAEGAQLNSVLSTAASSASLPRLRWALARLRALGGIYGEFTYHNATGYHTLAFERGIIISLAGSDFVVRAPNGATYTWLIVSDTVVRQNGGKTTTGALATGETVFTGGPVINGARDARLIVIRAGGSDTAQTSLS